MKLLKKKHNVKKSFVLNVMNNERQNKKKKQKANVPEEDVV
jgi:hypothetical protein